MTRAFSELNQFLPAVRRDEHGEFELNEPEALAWWAAATLASEPHLNPDRSVPPRTLADFPDRASADLGEDIRTAVALLEKAGLTAYALDQSRPDIELRVAKVLVPGMRHFWRRLREGRLYDVPVRMGRLAQPRREDELNPKNIWF
jgi:ribosomal protein S12 methylthiotransferase accessory factor